MNMENIWKVLGPEPRSEELFSHMANHVACRSVGSARESLVMSESVCTADVCGNSSGCGALHDENRTSPSMDLPQMAEHPPFNVELPDTAATTLSDSLPLQTTGSLPTGTEEAFINTDSPFYLELDGEAALLLPGMETFHLQLVQLRGIIHETRARVRALRRRARAHGQGTFECTGASETLATRKPTEEPPTSTSIEGDPPDPLLTDDVPSNHITPSVSPRSLCGSSIPVDHNIASSGSDDDLSRSFRRTRHNLIQATQHLAEQCSDTTACLETCVLNMHGATQELASYTSEANPTGALSTSKDTESHDGNSSACSMTSFLSLRRDEGGGDNGGTDEDEEGASTECVPLRCPLTSSELAELQSLSCSLARHYRKRGQLLRHIDALLLRHASVMWESNEERVSCYRCKRPFSTLTRRHHCRRCGRLCCAECSNHVGKRQDTSVFVPGGASLSNAKATVKTEYAWRMTESDTGSEPEELVDTHTYRHRSHHSEVRVEGNPLTMPFTDSASITSRTNDLYNELNDPATVEAEEQDLVQRYGISLASRPTHPQYEWLRLCGTCYQNCLRARKGNVPQRMKGANRCILEDGYDFFYVLSAEELCCFTSVVNKPDLFRKRVKILSGLMLVRSADCISYAPKASARAFSTAARQAPQALKALNTMRAYGVRALYHIAPGRISQLVRLRSTATPPSEPEATNDAEASEPPLSKTGNAVDGAESSAIRAFSPLSIAHVTEVKEKKVVELPPFVRAFSPCADERYSLCSHVATGTAEIPFIPETLCRLSPNGKRIFKVSDSASHTW